MANRLKVMNGLLIVIVLLFLGIALKATYIVTMPIAAAFFLTLLMRPVDRVLKDHLPKWLRLMSIVLTLLVVVVIVALGVGAVSIAAQLIISRGPAYAGELGGYLRSILEWAQSWGLPGELEIKSVDSSQYGQLIGILTAGITSVYTFAVVVVFTFVFVVLMLIEVEDWRKKTLQAFPDGRAVAVISMIETSSIKVRRFLVVQAGISLLSAVLEGSWLWIIGVEFALVWGMLFFVLDFIPSLGSVLASTPPILMALVQFGLPGAFLALGGILAIESVVANLVGPRLQGRTHNISPLAFVIALVFWGWIWGIVGMFLSTPITVMFFIICANSKSLKPLAILLSRKAGEEELIKSTTS